jgi:hypothetical protein
MVSYWDFAGGSLDVRGYELSPTSGESKSPLHVGVRPQTSIGFDTEAGGSG